MDLAATSVDAGGRLVVNYTLSNLDRVTDFTHQFPWGVTSAAQVLAQTTCPVAVFPTAATSNAGAKVRVLFNSIPDTPCNVAIGVTASTPGEFDLTGGFSSTTLGTRAEDGVGGHTFTVEDGEFVAHDATTPTLTFSVDATTDPDDGHVTSELLGDTQVLSYTITGRPYGADQEIGFTHTLPAGLELASDDDGRTILTDTCTRRHPRHAWRSGMPGIRAARRRADGPGHAGDPRTPSVPGIGESVTAADGVVSLDLGHLPGSDTDEVSSCTIQVLAA